MTDHRIEELANEVAAEVSTALKGFTIQRVDRAEDALKITFFWSDPLHIEVTINLHDYDTDESVKDAIRRQIQNA